MYRRTVLGVLAALAVALVSGGSGAAVAEDKSAESKGHEHFAHCAKACADCMRACESCAHHCAHLVAEGKKEHMRSLGNCVDCAEFCASAAKIVSRQGLMMAPACAACAKACDTCAEECDRCCEKSPDEHMKACAKACRDCSKACHEMVQHAGAGGARDAH